VARTKEAIRPSGVRALAAHVALLGAAALVGLIALELLSRIVFPISPGSRTLTLDGAPNPISLHSTPLRLPPDDVFRMVSEEFDVLVTTTDLGFRGPKPRYQPEMIFLGDSFTFGHGLGDRETFAFLYCEKRALNCANLGRGGTGTHRQLDILSEFLDAEQWQPKEVKLFLMAMTSALMDGNDLIDNIKESAKGGTWRIS
jgi:hypothetical protein